jgi:hypothetical protein
MGELKETLVTGRRDDPRKPLWVAIEQARREFLGTSAAFSNQEAGFTELVGAAEKLRALQVQWKNA